MMLNTFHRLVGLVFIFIIALLSASMQVSAQQNNDETLNIILLVDSSGSTAPDRELIQQATEFLFDYLDANVETQNLDYRLGIVGFNEGIIQQSQVRLGRLSKSDVLAFFANTTPTGDTDFKSAFGFALAEFERLDELGDGQLPIVILMTDGQPDLGNGTLVGDELDDYFDDIASFIGDFDRQDVEVFVVGVGDARGDQARWQSLLEDSYVYIEDSRNLGGAYWQFLSPFLGDGQEVIEFGNNQFVNIEVEPFLDKLTFAILKDDPITSVNINMPRNYPYLGSPNRGGQENDLHEIYIFNRPEGGEWRINLDNGGGRVLVARSYVRVRVETEKAVVATDTPFRVRIIFEGQALSALNQDRVDVRLQVDGETLDSLFSRQGDGSYLADIAGFDTPRSYLLEPQILVDGNEISAVVKLPATKDVVAEPKISEFDVFYEPDSGILLVEYAIQASETISEVSPLLLVTDDVGVSTEINIDNFDYSQEDQTFEYNLSNLDDGQYQFELQIEGITNDGLPYQDKSFDSIAVQSPSVEPPPVPPIVTEIPTITPTPTPEEEEENGVGEVSLFWLVLIGVVLAGVVLLARNIRNQPQDSPDPPNEETPNNRDDSTKAKTESASQKIKEAESFGDFKAGLDELSDILGNDINQHVPLVKDRLHYFWKAYKGNGEPKQFYRRVLPELLDARGNELHRRPAIQELDDIWADENDLLEHLNYVYQVLLYEKKLSFDNLVTNLTIYGANSDLAELLKKVHQAQRSQVYVQVANLTDRGIVLWIHWLYRFLNDINNYTSFNTPLSQEPFIELQNSEKPAVINSLIEQVAPIFSYMPKAEGFTKEDWDAFYVKLFDIAEGLLARKETKTLLWEFTAVADGLKRLAQLSELYVNDVINEADGNAIFDPGQIEVEYRVSLSLREVEEKISYGDWYVKLMLVIYHYAGADISEVKYRRRFKNQDQVYEQEPIKSMPANGCKVVQVYEGVPKSKTTIYHEFRYLSKKLRGVILEETWLPNDDVDVYEMKGGEITIRPQPNPKAIDNPFPPIGEPISPLKQPRAFILPDGLIERVKQYIRVPNASRLAFLHGLRQSGKTTTLLHTLYSLSQDDGSDQKFLFINTFLVVPDTNERIDDQEATKKVNIYDSYDFFIDSKASIFTFRQHLLKSMIHFMKLGRLDIDLVQQAESILKAYENGVFVNNFGQFDEKCGELFKNIHRHGYKIVWIFQEADRFESLGQDNNLIFDRLMNWVNEGEVSLVFEADNIDVSWQHSAERAYRDSTLAKSHSGRGIQRFYTTCLGKSQVDGLVGHSPFLFTDMAKIAIWNFTGGYVSLIQYIAKNMVDERLEEQGDANEIPVFTVADVKAYMQKIILFDAPLLDYVQSGFDRDEKVLMYLLITEYFIDTKTGILTDIFLRESWYGPGLRRLAIKAEEKGFSELENKLPMLLQRLYLKEVLRPVIWRGKAIPLVRWPFGLLSEYWKNIIVRPKPKDVDRS